ncbi:hypothetical protein BT93_L0564 [Corymbia citriodora subsp. variegata]|uniref:Uncharacterized protein n=1 Tax=Corymbia citriodora subsp. variegata TaxID=360336 RepID=A0A8T0CEJ6_CORYI|nr:hypothetical protein BT93_L0564 [Corymbia citriodora subsp. variegata]
MSAVIRMLCSCLSGSSSISTPKRVSSGSPWSKSATHSRQRTSRRKALYCQRSLEQFLTIRSWSWRRPSSTTFKS